MRFFSLLAITFLSLTGQAFAQAQSEEKSGFITYVEEKLSTPNMQIALNGLKGTLSSNVSLSSITVADKDGVYLTIVKPQLVWSRAALLRGRVEIDKLTAERIDFPRKPKPDDSLPDAEAKPFQLPDLPVSIRVDELAIDRVVFGAPVFGLAAEASVEGSIRFADAKLDVDLTVDRLDAGGAMAIQAAYGGEPAELTLALSLQEPENGIIANMLDLDGKPPITLVVNGEGPVDDFGATIAFDVADERVLDGMVELDRQGDALKAQARFSGPLGKIMPANQRAFYGESSRLEADLNYKDNGEVVLDRLLLDSGALQLVGDARLTADKFLSALNVDFRLSPNDGGRIVLPGEGAQPSFGSLRAKVDYDAASNDEWNAVVEAGSVDAPAVKIETVGLVASGEVKNFNQAERRSLQYAVTGMVRGLNAQDKGVQDAIGESLELNALGSWKAGQPFLLDGLRLVGQAFELKAKGAFHDGAFDGSADLDADRLAAFSGLAKRDLRGSADLALSGKIRPLDGIFDLTVQAKGQEVRVGLDRVDALLGGETNMSGGVARDEAGLTFDNLRIVNNQFNATLNGAYGSGRSDIAADVLLADLGLVSPQASGPVRLAGRVVGQDSPFDANLTISLDKGRLAGRDVRVIALAFDGTTDLASLQGELSGNGSISAQSLTLAGTVDLQAERQALTGFNATLGATRLKGDLTRDEAGLLDGELSVQSDDIAAAAALVLVDASGAVNGTVSLSGAGGEQGGRADLSLQNLRYGDVARIGSADVDAAFETLFSQPKINADLKAQNIRAGGVVVRRLDGDVETQGERTHFVLDAALDEQNARLQTEGSLVQSANRTEMTLAALDVTSSLTNARLQRPVTITLADGVTRIDDARLQVGSGSVRVDGTAGERLGLGVTIDALPLSIANVFAPELDAGGTISGTVQVSGTATSPRAQFSLRGGGLSARALSDAGITPVSVAANGQYANKTVQLSSVEASNSQGIALSGSGTVPLQGGGLDLRITGTAPLGLGEVFLENRGTRLSGTVRLNASVVGSLADPQFGGQVSVNGATVSDPLSNVRLNNLAVDASLDGDRLTLRRATAQLSRGGNASASGSVLLRDGMEADLDIVLSGARYTDGETFSSTVSGRLKITGPVTRSPLLSGRVEVARTEIIVPENLGGASVLLDVDHVAPSPEIARTLQRVERASPTPVPDARPVILNLDLTVVAPARIFVRGRGLDAELGGSVTLRGPVNNIQPQGRFELKRGRLLILGQRIVLDEGNITLTGTLDPLLYFRASVAANDVTAYIILSGRASTLDVSFESEPALPEDEVLSRVIFGRSVSELSPFQIARLVSAAAELTGGQNTNIVSGLRNGAGLDDLDVVSDADGNASVRAGKYLSDNVYLGVEAGQETKATINLDITDELKAKGSVSSEGESEIGIFFEHDY